MRRLSLSQAMATRGKCTAGRCRLDMERVSCDCSYHPKVLTLRCAGELADVHRMVKFLSIWLSLALPSFSLGANFDIVSQGGRHCGRCYPHCIPISTPCFLPINDERPPNFGKDAMPSEVALTSQSWVLPSLSSGAEARTSFTLLTILSTDVDRCEGHSDPTGAQLHFGV